MGDALIVYVIACVILTNLLIGGVGGYWIRATEDRPRRRRDRRLIEGLRALHTPKDPPRGRHAAPKEGTPDD